MRFITAYLNALTKAIYEPKRVEWPYREPTPPRRQKISVWRDMNPGHPIDAVRRARQHKKWAKLEKNVLVRALHKTQRTTLVANRCRGTTQPGRFAAQCCGNRPST
ncbi:MAG TPA: hypothetical protein VJ840_18680 [Gemmatimonadaceae bacterium]|nr:hypothetical protein [Gemmatimonadaceae bacterium]